jgi:xanthine dehydrogenase accessory factor
MAVCPQTMVNTIGGGHLEFQAITEARALLARPAHITSADHAASSARGNFSSPLTHEDNALTTRYALGPAVGHCCGGVVHLKFERISAADASALKQRLRDKGQPIALFGGGHVGRALVNVLSTLPYHVQWVDSRDEIFPAQLPPNVVCEHSDPVHAAVADVPSGASVLIMSFSHAEDLDVVAACLQRQRINGDLKFVGLIGSQTKWATFQHRLEAKGFSAQELAFITCPIGLPDIAGKEPEVIAVSVAAQLLQNH